LKIVVCVKQVPDTAASIVAVDGKATWGDASLVLNPWDEYAVEAALLQDGDVTAITVGEEGPNEALKQALAMGCGDAILIADPALAGASSQVIAKALAAAVRKIGDVDLVVFGQQAVDSDLGVTGPQTARVLGWPSLTGCAAIEISVSSLKVERAVEEGRQMVESRLPAAVSVSKDIGEPRYPSFMGIRKAARAVIPTWTLADLGLVPTTPTVSWPEIYNPPARDVSVEIIQGSSPAEIAATLADRIISEKVI